MRLTKFKKVMEDVTSDGLNIQIPGFLLGIYQKGDVRVVFYDDWQPFGNKQGFTTAEIALNGETVWEKRVESVPEQEKYLIEETYREVVKYI